MPFININGRELSFKAEPNNYGNQETAVVMIHGSGGDADDWKGQLSASIPKTALIALELPGHGASQGAGESDVSLYAEWVNGFISKLPHGTVVLVGCSLGSAIVQWVALKFKPDKLKGIGLVGAGARLKVHPDFLEGLKTHPDTALNSLAEFCLSKKSTNLFDEINRKYAGTSPELVHGDLTACHHFDVMDDIANLSLPCFIVVGKEDRLTPVKYSKYLHETIKGSRLTIIPDAGHLVMLEQPDQFNRAMIDFLQEFIN